MSNRPLFSKRNHELVELFENNLGDIDVLKLIKSELKHRSTSASKSLKERVSARLESLSKNLHCPKCGASTVFRTGKHGVFRGCSRYPKCDGIAH